MSKKFGVNKEPFVGGKEKDRRDVRKGYLRCIRATMQEVRTRLDGSAAGARDRLWDVKPLVIVTKMSMPEGNLDKAGLEFAWD